MSTSLSCSMIFTSSPSAHSPRRIGEAKRVAVHFDIVDCGPHLVAREDSFHEGEVPAHLEDLVHMLDICRADMLAGKAGGARPENILGDFFDQPCLGLEKATSPICFTTFMGDRGLPGRIGRAAFLAALASSAGVGIENILPREVIDFCRAELFGAFVLKIDGGDTPPG